MKKILFMMLAMALSSPFATAQRLQQKLGRGVVAVYRSGGRSVTSAGGTNSSLISWRKLAQEPEGTTYNVYKRAVGTEAWTKMNPTPLKVTNYTPSSLTNNTEYAVTAIVNGVEGEKSNPFLYKTQPWPNVWFKFDFDDKVIKRNDYRTKFVWPMDLDGNGEYDAVVVDRLFAGAAEVDPDSEDAEVASTTSHKIQAYKLDGTLLWTVDMGPNVNICSGQNDMVLAYDINCDGKCEVIVRSSDGTRFWDKANETWGTYVGGKTTGDIDGDGIIDYRTQGKRNPPFYISVIEGATGAELTYNELKYTELTEPNGGDAYRRDNRADYMSAGYGSMEGHYGIAYLDGVHPSLIMECEDRGTDKNHHGYVLTWDFDWANGQASNWHHSHTWVRNPVRPWCAEFHQIRILDSDGDGCDEMWAGGYGVNPALNRYTSTGLEHGDRFILSDIDPDRPGMEGYAIQQSALLGQCLYDAATGERLKEWYLPSIFDVARGGCMDIDPSHKGYEIYSFTDDYIYDSKGDATGETRSQWGISTVFEGLWWNADLLREELSSPGGKNYGTNLMVTTVRGKSRLVEFSQESNWGAEGATGTRPAFMGDIMGDWREEVILAHQNDTYSQGLVGYTTNLSSDYSIYCLQQDPHYRGDCTTRGYYQHPNTSFYLGVGMPLPPLPPVMETDLRYHSGNWSNGSTAFTSYDQKSAATYADGKSVLFDITGSNASAIEISGDVKPGATYFMNPKKKDYVLKGNIGGEGIVVKSQQGTVTLNGNLTTTGKTIVSEGTLALNGTMAGELELRAKGTLAGNPVLNGAATFEGGLNYEGCRLSPGTVDAPFGVITVNGNLTLTGDVFVEANLQTSGTVQVDKVMVNGDLTLKNTNTLTIVPSEDVPAEGEYVLLECTGALTAAANKINVRGLVGLKYEVEVREKQIVLVIHPTREASLGVVWTGAVNKNWDYQTNNFQIDGTPTSFVANDEVIFPSDAVNKNVNLTDLMVTNGVRFTHESGTYVFSGDGGFSGAGDFVMNGKGSVTLNATKSNYTGKTILNSGTVAVKNLEMKGVESCFGAGDRIEIGKATLTINNTNAATNRNIVLTDTATINIPGGTATIQSAVTGSKGVLLKNGAGQLNLNYGGVNNYKATILNAGTLSQGAWQGTFGAATSPIHVTGNSKIQIFDANSSSTMPNFQNAVTIDKGKTLTFNVGSRCSIRGSLLGEGTIKISFAYVRGDVYTNVSNFEGTYDVMTSNCRFIQAMDFSKTILKLESGAYAAGFKSGSGTEQSYTHKVGSLQGSGTIGTGTWNVGYRGEDDTFAGVFNGAAIVNKYGDGAWTLTGASQGALNIYAGSVLAQNASAPVTTGSVTVRNGGLLAGTGQVQNVTVMTGGTLGAGKSVAAVGTLTVKGNLTMNSGSTLRVRTRSIATGTNSDAFKVAGNVKLTSPVIDLTEQLNSNYTFADDAELKVFTGDGNITISGTVTLLPETPKPGYLWDTSALASEGIIRVVADPTGIRELSAENLTDSDVIYDLSGRRVKTHALNGVYIVNGSKVYIKE